MADETNKPQIFEGYIANWRNYPKDEVKVRVARPSLLAPSQELLSDFNRLKKRYGREGAWSDIDILVISERFSGMKPHEKIGALLEFKTGRVEALGYTPEEFLSMIKKMNPLALDAAVRGLPLYGEEFFDKARELVKELKIERRGKMWVKKEQ